MSDVIAAPVSAGQVTPTTTVPAPAQAHTKSPISPSQPRAANAKEPVSKAPPAPVTPEAPQAEEELWEVPSYDSSGKKIKMKKEEVIRNAAKVNSAFRQFEEAAQMRREAESLLGRLRDPKEAVKLLNDPKLGLDKNQVREAFEEWYEENVIRPSEMTPEQRELSDAKKRLSQYEQEKEERRKAEEAQENAKLDSFETERIQKEIISLIDKSGLPKTRFTSSRIAYWLRVNESKGLNAPAELIVDQVKKETNDVMRSLVQSSDGEMLVNLLGEDTVKKLRSYDLARIRAKRGLSNPETPSPEDEDHTTKGRKGKITVQEWKENLRNWK